MSAYPDRHHPVFFLQDALTALGADAVFNGRDSRTEGCWGLIVNGKPMVWLIDNRHSHEAEKEDPAAKRLLDAGALVCHAQKPDMERVGGRWLPLAVTPGYGVPMLPRGIFVHDVGFVGYVRDTARMQMLTHVARHFRLSILQGEFGDQAVMNYIQSAVGLNIPTGYGAPDAYDSANMRCFEILATGTPLVTPHESYLMELGLQDSANCLTYKNGDDLLMVIRKAVDNPDWSARIGREGAKRAAERHTYEARARQVLEWLE